MKKHLIVARYNESLEWLKEIDCFDEIFIYNKGSERSSNNEIKLPNIGREAHTFSYHIARNYDNLGDINIFLQGNPFDHAKKLKSDESLKSFFINTNYDTVNSIPFLCDLIEDIPRNTALCYEDCLKGDIPNPILFAPGAQWIVPQKNIKSKSKKFYINLLRNLSEKERFTNTDGIYNAWNLEGMWNYIFSPLTIEK